MALREFVTASDMCTPDGGAGPSNAAAGLANTLLGRSAKDQERLRELPGIQGQPGPSVYRPAHAHTVNAIAEAAVQGDLPHIPGMASSSASPFSVDEFLQGVPQAGPRNHQQEHFDAIYQQGLQHGRPPGQWQHQAPPSMYPPVNADAQVLSPSLQAFMESGRARAAFHPMPLPQMRLSVEDQCRVRDRSTIMARHMYADRGDAFADEQVGKLLRSLNINAEQLPSGGQGPPQSWDAIFRAGAPRYLHEGPAVADVAAGSQMAALHGPENGWASEFAGLSLAEQGQDHAPNTWAAEFHQTAASPRQRWVEDFAAEQGQGWAEEFGRSQAGAAASLGKADQQQDHAATLAQTKALAEHLAKDGNPKMKNSQFLQFLSKMSQGEIILEDNQVKEVAGAALGAQWANEFAAQAGAPSQMVEEFLAQPQARHGAAHSPVPDQWADQFGAEGYGASEWADQFANQLAAGTDVDSWMEDFAKEMDEQVAAQRASGVASTSGQEYVFQPNNPFLSDPDSAEKGKQLFRHGLLSEAVLAFEAEVQRHPNNVEAWRMLGTVQAENDDDTQAIAALNRALQADPDNAEVLLSLGVSYTNELDQAQALNYLHRWLSQHPTHSPAATAVPDPGDTSQRLAWVMRSFEEAAATAPADGDLQAALGVLYNLSREYEKAVTAFRTSLQIQPKDYSLWNKLGATLANSSHSADAITAYQRALELKPNYMRAWTNMGISQANVGEYEVSARYYTRALALNPSASSVWGYLRTSLACAGRMDLMAAVDNEDLPSLQEALPLI